VISNLLSVSEEGAGADDFLPILIYVLILAAPPQLESNLAFIMRYRLASRLTGEAAYFYTNMVSATTFIETIEPNSLSIDPAEFIAHMQAAGVPGSEDNSNDNKEANASASNSNAAGTDLLSGSDVVVGGEEEKKRTMTMTTPPAAAAAAAAAPEANVAMTGQEESLLNPSHIAAAAPEDRRLSNPSSTSGGNPSSSSTSLLPLSAVEEKGSGMLLEAEGLGELHMRYKFLYASLSDLKLKDVKVLLDDYKEIALKYESLSRGYKLLCGEDVSAAQTPTPQLVKAFHRVDPVHDSMQVFGNASTMSTNSSENLIRLAESPNTNTNSAPMMNQNIMAPNAPGGLPEPPKGNDPSGTSEPVALINPAFGAGAGAADQAGGDVFNSLPTPPTHTDSTANSPLPDLLG
jgi:hypothetical protein